jgi:hypothetical protein
MIMSEAIWERRRRSLEMASSVVEFSLSEVGAWILGVAGMEEVHASSAREEPHSISVVG